MNKVRALSGLVVGLALTSCAAPVRVALPDPIRPPKPDAAVSAPPVFTADAVPVRVGVAVIGTVIVFGLMMAARSLNQRAQAR